MASLTLTVSKVRRTNGKVYVVFSDGLELEFSSLADAREYRDGLVTALGDTLRRFVVARFLRVNPNGDNPALIEGRSITVTDESNTMIQVT